MEKYIKAINRNDLDLLELEKIRVEIFGKKGILAQGFASLKNLTGEEKINLSIKLNEQRDKLNELINKKKIELISKMQSEKMQKDFIDASLFNENLNSAALHPVMSVMDKIIEYFLNQNFSLESGPLIEDDFHNFQALNIAENHPARDMQDSFYLKDFRVLRTHTSPVQIRTMMANNPPIRIIAPGAVFRRDFDLTHTPMFHQVEGLVVQDGKDVSFANLKSMLENFLHFMFGDIKIRFRPSFFPFTEPSAEVDISCIFCDSGCRVCKHTKWLEVLGCGVVDPNVFKAVGYKNVSGYAFGLGVERFAMLIHRIGDLRSLFEADLRLLEQFR